MRHLKPFLMSFALACAGTVAQAQDTQSTRVPVVVELFTSQGCSSCPPADAMMNELATRENVIALSLHVDYWDYIGWKDHFAQPKFTLRQKAYAKAAGKRTIYTPQIIVQGADHVIGNKPMKLAELIDRRMTRDAPPAVGLIARRDGTTLTIHLTPVAAGLPVMRVQLVRYKPHERVAIGRGENAGREIDYSNIVTEWTVLRDWDGLGPLSIEAPVAGTDKAAVIVQANGAGPILAATVAN
ncbi:DUF1223 domain-containing protein [Celeribacter arenosi]|uniref:DUF1223 domain-containing protein n=1 Tax=Celeribacter arenosi TaxID=792649 RepID=A0ABP7KEE9_9RHOB